MVCRAVWQDITLVGYIFTNRIKKASENMTHPLVQYPAVLHSKPLNNLNYINIFLFRLVTHLSTCH